MRIVGSREQRPWGYSSVGRASRWQREGQEFESPCLHHFEPVFTGFFLCGNRRGCHSVAVRGKFDAVFARYGFRLGGLRSGGDALQPRAQTVDRIALRVSDEVRVDRERHVCARVPEHASCGSARRCRRRGDAWPPYDAYRGGGLWRRARPWQDGRTPSSPTSKVTATGAGCKGDGEERAPACFFSRSEQSLHFISSESAFAGERGTCGGLAASVSQTLRPTSSRSFAHAIASWSSP